MQNLPTLGSQPCSCKSGKKYSDCCQRYHEGAPAENALALMRSRYSAYALHLADYIIRTTHPHNPAYSKDPKDILAFAKKTEYYGLDILEFTDGEQEAYVTFKAYLRQGKRDISFIERSRFLKVNGSWFYESGQIQNT